MLASTYLFVVHVLLSVPVAISPRQDKKNGPKELATRAVEGFLWIWPVYYLPAWVGHLIFQKDIPAVFTYGTTFRGWAVGEFCAFGDLLEGGIVHGTQWVPTVVLSFALIRGVNVNMSAYGMKDTPKVKDS